MQRNQQALTSKKATLLIRPAFLVSVALVVLTSPLIVWGLMGLIYSDQWLPSVLLLILGLYVPVSVATVKFKLEADRLEKRALFFRRFDLPTSCLRTELGRGGDFGVHQALLIIDKSDNRVVDRLLTVQFRKRDIEALRGALASK